MRFFLLTLRRYRGLLLTGILGVVAVGSSRAVAADSAAPVVPAVSEYVSYPSSSDPSLRLFARFSGATPRGVLLVVMHGWHGQVKRAHSDNLANPAPRGYFVVEPEMRGRGDSTGFPDCNGWELQDVIDAVEFARERYRDRILSPEIVLLSGGSGGGGNVFALLGKYPDYFTAARGFYGISDYALWHLFDRKGEFRDELEGIAGRDPQGRPAWIGGTPESRPEAYRSRSGLTTAGNLLTPTLLFHGDGDVRVPVLQTRLWVGAALGRGRGGLVTYHELTGVGDHRWHDANQTPEQREFQNRVGEQFLRDHRTPPVLPEKGSCVVAGFVKTARFEVILDSIDRVGRVDYDLAAGTFHVYAPTARQARLRVRQGDGWRERMVDCQR